MATLADLLTARIPPHSLEAERAVLGVMLLDADGAAQMLEHLRPGDFYKDGHRLIFEAMLHCRAGGRGVDLVTVGAQLLVDQAEAQVPALALILDEAISLTELEAYAAIVREKAALREVIRLSTEVIGRAYDNGTPASGLLAHAAGVIETVRRSVTALIPRGALVSLIDLMRRPPARPVWLVDRLILQSSNGWVGAGAKVGKSYLILDFLLACALGRPWLETFAIPRPLRIALIEEEDSEWRVYERLARLLRGRGEYEEDAAGFSMSVRKGVQLDDEATLRPLLDYLRVAAVDLVVWDVFNKLHTKNEKQPEQMMPILRRVDRLRDEYGCANLILHHSRKPGVMGPDLASGGQQLRGPSEFWGWAENSLYLKPLKAKGAMIVEPESKDSLVAPFKVHLEDLPDDARRWVYDGEVAGKVSEGEKTRGLIMEALALNPMTVAQLVDHIRRSDRAIQKHLRALEEDGAVEFTKEPGRYGTKLWMTVQKEADHAAELPF
jgi:DNA-binding transcriptional ArsR family regulator